MAARFQVPERTLHTILRNSGVVSDGGMDVIEAERAVIAYYRAEATRSDDAAAKDRARKTKAEADDAEMDTLKKRKTLCFRDDYLNNYADAIAQGVRNISKLKGLTAEQKEDVLNAIRSVKLPEIEL